MYVVEGSALWRVAERAGRTRIIPHFEMNISKKQKHRPRERIMRRLYVLLCVSLASTCTTGLERRRRALLQGGPPEQIASTPIYQTHQGTSKDGGANVRACPSPSSSRPNTPGCTLCTRYQDLSICSRASTVDEFARSLSLTSLRLPPLPLSSPPWHLLTPHSSLHLPTASAPSTPSV